MLVNQNREQNNLTDLVRDPRLDASAAAKCQDMVSKNYWSHYAPDGKGINEWIIAQGVQFIHFGENLATGERSAQQVDSEWVNSPEHKANILDSKFTSVGYAVCMSNHFIAHSSAALVIVQHFAQE